MVISGLFAATTLFSDVTLNRFFCATCCGASSGVGGAGIFAHYRPCIRSGPTIRMALRLKTIKNAEGIPLDGIPFHPYYSVKDTFCAVAFLCLFAMAIFFAPEMGGYFLEYPNFEPANSLKTPEHIAPVWYFTPYYAILRAVPPFLGTQVWGVLAMGLSIVFLFALPWLDNSPVRFYPLSRLAIQISVV